ncbi:TIGR00266 family protein [bacterium]|nr:TIGR00266 family protein [bacterium]
MSTYHEIDYKILGTEMQAVEITLDPAETVISEGGSFMSMTDEVEVQTVLGSNASQSMWGKMVGAGKRLLTGESLFLTTYTQKGQGRGVVMFAAPYPGKIIPFKLSEHGGKIVCQKDSFLCAAHGVSVGIELQKKIGAGFFGGEGFIMQKLEGDGLAFVHAGGHIVEHSLSQGQVLKIDTGCLVAFESTVLYDIQYVGSIKTGLFGGEGLFYARLTGPGKVWVQSLPFSRLAGKVFSFMPSNSSNDSGSLLGGIGDLVMGE